MERRNQRRAEREQERASPAPIPAVEEEVPDFVPDAPVESLSFQALEGIEEKVKEKALDDDRPILMSSGYQPPSRWAYIAAFAFFGLSMILVLSVSPQVRGIMWPFDQGVETNFQQDQRPTIQDDNRLRNTSNIRSLDLLVQVPLFVLTWGLLLGYVYFAARILYSTGQSLWSSYQAKKVYEKSKRR